MLCHFFKRNIWVVHFYQVDVLKDLNVSRSLNFHFDSVIPASLAGVFLHLTFLPSWYVTYQDGRNVKCKNTPAREAGITESKWKLRDLLTFRSFKTST